MRPIHYFAYGSNLDVEQMTARCPSSRARFRACLLDHRLDFTYYAARWSGGAADVRTCPGECVWGVVYELTPDDLARLDGYEAGYERIELSVLDDSGNAHRVVSYSVLSKGEFAPHAIYLDKLLKWGEHWEFPAPYLEQLRLLRDSPGERDAAPGHA
jgi:hypothetical protein